MLGWDHFEVLKEAREENEELLPRERLADALPLADAERNQVLSAHELSGCRQEVDVGIEALRSRPYFRLVVNSKQIREDNGALGNIVTAAQKI